MCNFYLELPPITKRLLLSANNALSESYATLDPDWFCLFAPLPTPYGDFQDPRHSYFRCHPIEERHLVHVLCCASFLFQQWNCLSCLYKETAPCIVVEIWKISACKLLENVIICSSQLHNRICTICKNIHCCPRKLKSLISTSSFVDEGLATIEWIPRQKHDCDLHHHGGWIYNAHERIDSVMFFNLLSEQPMQEKRQEEEDMTHVHGPYPCRKLALGPKVFKYPRQVGRYRDQAIVNSLETAYNICQYIYCKEMHI